MTALVTLLIENTKKTFKIQNIEANYKSTICFEFVERTKFRSTLLTKTATMSKQHSTLSKKNRSTPSIRQCWSVLLRHRCCVDGALLQCIGRIGLPLPWDSKMNVSSVIIINGDVGRGLKQHTGELTTEVGGHLALSLHSSNEPGLHSHLDIVVNIDNHSRSVRIKRIIRSAKIRVFYRIL